MNILVSSCLLGEPCRYDGQSRPVQILRELQALGHVLVPVCPEVLGGLPTPRSPAELQPGGRVLNRAGEDVTAAYRTGARLALETALAHQCSAAVLKEKSPSCGSGTVYDGTFSCRLVPGWGETARLLRAHGIRVLGESRASELLEE